MKGWCGDWEQQRSFTENWITLSQLSVASPDFSRERAIGSTMRRVPWYHVVVSSQNLEDKFANHGFFFMNRDNSGPWSLESVCLFVCMYVHMYVCMYVLILVRVKSSAAYKFLILRNSNYSINN